MNGHTAFPFRWCTTLKKLQARWYGNLDTATLVGHIRRNPQPINDDANDALKNIQDHPLAGTLRNRTAYTLQDVTVIAYADYNNIKYARVYDVKGEWKPGTEITLETDLQQRRLLMGTGDPLERMLDVVGRFYASKATTLATDNGLDRADKELANSQDNQAEFLSYLLDIRNAEGPGVANRTEFTRNFTRGLDRSATLRAGHVLILAVVKSNHENDKSSPVVPSPLALTVDGSKLEGDGDIYFAWSAELE